MESFREKRRAGERLSMGDLREQRRREWDTREGGRRCWNGTDGETAWCQGQNGRQTKQEESKALGNILFFFVCLS